VLCYKWEQELYKGLHTGATDKYRNMFQENTQRLHSYKIPHPKIGCLYYKSNITISFKINERLKVRIIETKSVIIVETQILGELQKRKT